MMPCGPTLEILGWIRVLVSQRKPSQKAVIQSMTINNETPLYMAYKQNMFSSRKMPYNIQNAKNILHAGTQTKNRLYEAQYFL